MSKFFKMTLAAAAVIVSVGAQAATTISVTNIALPSTGAIVKSPLLNGGAWSFEYAGEYILTTSSPSTFSAFCIDLEHQIFPTGVKSTSLPASYSVSLQALDSVARLFKVSGYNGLSFATDGVNTAAKSAALQLAIWEAVYDGFGGSLTGGGTFKSSNNAYIAQANSYLTAAAALTAGSYNGYVQVLTSLDDPQHQTLVTAVPEPSTYALMAACLGVMGLVARRKQNA